MVSVHGAYGMRWWCQVLIGAVALSASGETSLAGDRHVVQRDGRKIRLIRSGTEAAVRFQDSKQVWTSARRMATSGAGVLTDVPGAPFAPIKLLRWSDKSVSARGLAQQDPTINETFPVYRFEGSDTPVISTGTIVLKFREGLSGTERARFLAGYRLAMIAPVGGLSNVYAVRPVDQNDDEVLRAEALALDTRIIWAQPNFRVPKQLHQAAPADQFYGRQWHLNNTGQLGGLTDADIDAPEAWVLGAEGQDIIVGMLDDSCDIDHEDLRGNYTGTGNDPSLPSTADGFTDPRPKIVGDYHGTPVMGLAVARANSLGIRGVAHLSRFTASRGIGQLLTDAEIANAYLFARQQEVDVHINSWGLGFGAPIPAIIEDALETAFIEGRDLDGAEGADPPRGMVVMFASGNGINGFGPGIRLDAREDLSTLPTVIGVGATNDQDQIAFYSNYGPEIDVLAPGGGDFTGITTTDNDDSAGYIEDGLNVGGVDEFGNPELDSAGRYIQSFSGTSAACPIAAGAAAMILSVNPLLTATDVRLILEHTCDKVSREEANYDRVTNRSVRYGYGRINASEAVRAAQEAVTNGGRTWPERVANVQISADQGRLTWVQNGDPLEFVVEEDEEDGQEGGETTVLRTTDEFLVLQSDGPFEFIPLDGVCYDRDQIGCGSTTPAPLPANVEALAVGCGLTCGTDTSGSCEAGAPQCVEFLQPAGKKYLAIYARSLVGRYSFGVKVDTDGNITDPGLLPPRATPVDGGGGGGGISPDIGPKVTINVSPLEGTSPLTVAFAGNASSTLAIDDSRTAWDFDIDDGITVDATTRNAQHTYFVPLGESKTFIARLTMYDVEGNIGFAQTAIRVIGTAAETGGTTGETEVGIIIGVPGTVGSDVDRGTSPFQVELSIDASSLAGTVQSVFWDLGDGTTATSLFVSHIYVNTTGIELRIPITATVTTLSSGGTTNSTTVSRRITVLPGAEPVEDTDPVCEGCGAEGPGGSATPCGTLGLLPLLVGFGSLLCLRRCRF